MATRARGRSNAANITITPGTADDGGSGDEPDEQTADQLQRSAGEGKKQPRARIMRWNDELRTYATIDHVSAANVDEDWIMSEYGGGKYLVYFWGTKRDGTYGYLKEKGQEYVIDPSIPFKGSRAARPKTGTLHNADGTPAGRSEDPDGNLRTLRENQIVEMMRDQADARQQVAMMTMNMMKTMSESSAAMIAAISNMANASRSTDALTIKDIIPLVTSRGGDMDAVLKILPLLQAQNGGGLGGLGGVEGILDLADRLNRRVNGEPEEVTTLGVIKDLGPKVLEALTALAGRTGSRPAPATATTGALPMRPRVNPAQPTALPRGDASPPTAEPAPSVPAEPAHPEDDWTPLEPAMEQLLAAARAGKDVRHVVGMLMLMASDEQKAMLREVIDQDDVIEVVTARFPAFAQRRAWLTDFVDELRAEFGLDGDDGTGDGDDDADANADANTAKGNGEDDDDQ